MGGEANGIDRSILDRFLNTVLDHYKDGVISWSDAHSTLAAAMSLAGGSEESMTHHMQAYLDHDPRDGL